MDNQLLFRTTPNRAGIYAVIYSTAGLVWNGSSFEPFDPARWALYAIAMIETSPGSGLYAAGFPVAIPPGTYGVVAFMTVGAQPDSTDPTLGELPVGWDGANLSPPCGADTDFADGLNSLVQIEIDVNATGAPTTDSEDAMAGPTENYQPVPGLTAIPCRIVQQNWPPPAHMWTKAVQSATAWHKVLFAGVMMVDERHRLNWVDQATNERRYLYPMGRSKNAHQMGVYSRADALEFSL